MKTQKHNLWIILVSILFIVMTSNMQAQFSPEGAVKKLVSKAVSGTFDLEGTWRYEGSSLELQSSNILKKAGAKVAQSTLQNNIDEELEKLGFTPGYTTFVFKEDGTFINTTKDRTIKGKYSHDTNKNILTLKYAGKVPIRVNVSGSGNSMSLTLKADQLLSLASIIGGMANSSLGTLLDSYDGMMIGLKLDKQQK